MNRDIYIDIYIHRYTHLHLPSAEAVEEGGGGRFIGL
jgi:hypothetical protein